MSAPLKTTVSHLTPTERDLRVMSAILRAPRQTAAEISAGIEAFSGEHVAPAWVEASLCRLVALSLVYQDEFGTWLSIGHTERQARLTPRRADYKRDQGLMRDLDRAAAVALVDGSLGLVISAPMRRKLAAWLEEHPS